MRIKFGRWRALFTAATIAVGVAGFLAWRWGGTDALLAVLVGVVVIGLGVVVQVIVRGQRGLTNRLDRQIRALQQETIAAHHTIKGLVRDLEAAGSFPAEFAEALLKGIGATNRRIAAEQSVVVVDEIKKRHRASLANQERLLKHVPAEIDAMLQVHRRADFDPVSAAPLMGGWAMSARGILQLVDLVASHEIVTILEFGPGTSTMFMARELMRLDRRGARIVALEHDPEYAETSAAAIRHLGLERYAEVRLAPLTAVDLGGETYSWYDLKTIGDLEAVDLLVVDGPPGSTGPLARFPAYPLTRGLLRPGGFVLLDDARRDDEVSIAEAWIQSGGLEAVKSLSDDQAVWRVAGYAESERSE